MKKTITCKNCHTSMTINLETIFKKGDRIAFECPKCKHQIKLKKRQNKDNGVPKTTVASSNTANGTPPTSIKPLSQQTWCLQENTTKMLFELDQPFLSFGRKDNTSDADLQFETQDYTMSRKHCVLKKERNGITIKNTSLNGVTINGNSLNKDEEMFLEVGQQIKMGKHLFTVIQK